MDDNKIIFECDILGLQWDMLRRERYENPYRKEETIRQVALIRAVQECEKRALNAVRDRFETADSAMRYVYENNL